MYPEIATPLNDHELVLHHLRNGKDFSIEMLATYPYLLFKTFLFKESIILRDTSDIETIEDIFFLDDRHRYIPELVVDYILLTIMVNNRNIYAVTSQITQDIFHEGYCAVKDRVKIMDSIDDIELKEDRHQLINFEFELLELLVADENMQILVPFFFRNHWILVMRRLVNGKLLFFIVIPMKTQGKHSLVAGVLQNVP
jgi:hypothetical protein